MIHFSQKTFSYVVILSCTVEITQYTLPYRVFQPYRLKIFPNWAKNKNPVGDYLFLHYQSAQINQVEIHDAGI